MLQQQTVSLDDARRVIAGDMPLRQGDQIVGAVGVSGVQDQTVVEGYRCRPALRLRRRPITRISARGYCPPAGRGPDPAHDRGE